MTDEKKSADTPKHKLRCGFTFSCIAKKKGTTQVAAYTSAIRKIATVHTAEDFWQTYAYLQRPSSLPAATDLQFFREGISPLWEDPANKNGGKLIIRLKKGMASRCWEDLLLEFLGNQFGMDDEVCGIVMSTRYKDDILSIWNKSGNDKDVHNRLRDVVRRVLGISSSASLDYKTFSIEEENAKAERESEAAGGGGGGDGDHGRKDDGDTGADEHTAGDS